MFYLLLRSSVSTSAATHLEFVYIIGLQTPYLLVEVENSKAAGSPWSMNLNPSRTGCSTSRQVCCVSYGSLCQLWNSPLSIPGRDLLLYRACSQSSSHFLSAMPSSPFDWNCGSCWWGRPSILSFLLHFPAPCFITKQNKCFKCLFILSFHALC